MSEEKKTIRIAVVGGHDSRRALMIEEAVRAAARDGLIEVVQLPPRGEMRLATPEPVIVVDEWPRDEAAVVRRAAFERLTIEPPAAVRTPLTAHDQERLRLAEIKRARKAQKMRRNQR